MFPLHSEITLDEALGTIWVAEDQTQLNTGQMCAKQEPSLFSSM